MNKAITVTGSILSIIAVFLLLSSTALAWFPHGPFDRDLTDQEKIYVLNSASAYALGLKGVVWGCVTSSNCDFEVQFYDWNNDEWDTVFSGNVDSDGVKHFSATLRPFTAIYDDEGMFQGTVRTFDNLQGLADYSDIDTIYCDPYRKNELNGNNRPELSPNARFGDICRRDIITDYSNKICDYGQVGSYEKWTAQKGRYAQIANTCYRYDARCFLVDVEGRNPSIDYYQCAGKAVDLESKYVENRQVKYRLLKDDYGAPGFNQGDNFFEIRTLAETNPYTAYDRALTSYNAYLTRNGRPTVSELPALVSRGSYQYPQFSITSESGFSTEMPFQFDNWFLANQIYLYVALLSIGITLVGIGYLGGRK